MSKTIELAARAQRIALWVLLIVVFVPCYIYCIVTYGFLWGLGFGWLPSGIVTAASGWVICWLVRRFVIWYDPEVRAMTKSRRHR
jgi:hypothetical protein